MAQVEGKAYHVYCHLLLLISLFLSFLCFPLNMKYLQCWSGPAVLPVMKRKIGTPTKGMKLSGKHRINSTICLKLNGP